MSVDKSNLRPLYNEIDMFLQENIIYPAKYDSKRKPGPIKRLLKGKSKRKSAKMLSHMEKSLVDYQDRLSGFIENASGYNISKEDISQILYERISHNASKHLKIGQDDIDESLYKYNDASIKRQDPAILSLSNLIPPYFLSKSSIDKITDLEEAKKILEEHSEKIKYLAEDQSKKPYALPNAFKAYSSIVRIKGTYLAQDRILERKQYNQVRKAYHAKLIQENSNRKKQPKKHLTEFEKEGIALMARLEKLNEAKIQAEIELSSTTANLKSAEKILNNVKSDDRQAILDDIENKKRNILEQQEKFAQAKDRHDRFCSNNKVFCEAFISHITENKSFNKRMGRALNSGKYEKKILGQRESIYMQMYKYSHKSKKFGALKALRGKYAKLLDRLRKKETVQEEEKLTLKEIGEADRATSNDNFLQTVESFAPETQEVRGIIEQNKELSKLHIEFVERINQENMEMARSGDLILDVEDKLSSFKNKVDRGIYDKFQKSITPYFHASLAHKGEEDLYVSHSTESNVAKERVSINSTAIFVEDHFRVYPDELIVNSDIRKKLEKVLDAKSPEELKEKLSEKFQQISYNISEDISKGDDKFENTAVKRTRAGIADFLPMGHKKRGSNSKWVDKVMSDGKVSRKALHKDTKGEMICSEFAARVIFLTLHKLEDDLKKQCADKGYQMPQEILENPLKNEKLSKVHPKRLLGVLKRLGGGKAVEQIENPLLKATVRK